MRTVRAAFPELQVIALDVDAQDQAVLGRGVHEGIATEGRFLALLGADHRPDQPAFLAHGKAWLLQPFTDPRIGVVRRVEDGAVHSELPAVIETAQPAFLDTAERQRRAPMHAVLL
ncbi:MAG: hypothetical protein ACE368_10295 [Paracoccaceae bacterium]